MNDETYHYTEDDVEKMLHFLSTNLPKYATPENAIKTLVYLHNQMKSFEDLSPSEVETFLQDLEEA